MGRESHECQNIGVGVEPTRGNLLLVLERRSNTGPGFRLMVDVDQGREEWCDLFFKILLLFFKILLFAINFLPFEAHLSCALFEGRF